MRPLTALVPVLAILLTPLTVAAAGPAGQPQNQPPAAGGGLRAELKALADKARKAFVAGQSVKEAVPESELTRLEGLPELKQAEGKKWDGVNALDSYKNFTAALAEATRVQDSGLSPEGPERLKPVVISQFFMVPEEIIQAEARYRRAGKDPVTPDERRRLEAERAKLEEVMANPRLPADQRAALSAKMQRISSQLRWDPGEAGGNTVLAAFGTGQPLTASDFRRLNAGNLAPGANTLRSGSVPTPSSAYADRARAAADRFTRAHTAQDGRRQAVLAEADRESENVEGIASDAYRFWDSMDKEKPADESTAGRWFRKGTAKTMRGLLTLSGLTAVERSAARAGYLAGSDDVTGWDQTKAYGAMGGNMALSAMNFIPAAGMASRLANGERAVTWISRGGTAAAGVRAATPEAATAITEVGGNMQRAVRAAVPAGAKPSEAQLGNLLERYNEVGRAYGVEARVGGVVGEAQAANGVTTVSLAKGASHEVVHVGQTMLNDMAALERAAARSNVSVQALSQEARAAAFTEARAFERAGYLQHEAQAFKATGFGGGGRANYAELVSQNLGHTAQSNITGTVLGGRYGAAANAYGATGALLGDSQRLLFTNGYWASANLIYPTLNAATDAGLNWAMNLSEPAPQPAPAPRPRK